METWPAILSPRVQEIQLRKSLGDGGPAILPAEQDTPTGLGSCLGGTAAYFRLRGVPAFCAACRITACRGIFGVLFHCAIEQSRRVPIVVAEDSTEPLPAGDATPVRFCNVLDHPIARALSKGTGFRGLILS